MAEGKDFMTELRSALQKFQSDPGEGSTDGPGVVRAKPRVVEPLVKQGTSRRYPSTASADMKTGYYGNKALSPLQRDKPMYRSERLVRSAPTNGEASGTDGDGFASGRWGALNGSQPPLVPHGGAGANTVVYQSPQLRIASGTSANDGATNLQNSARHSNPQQSSPRNMNRPKNPAHDSSALKNPAHDSNTLKNPAHVINPLKNPANDNKSLKYPPCNAPQNPAHDPPQNPAHDPPQNPARDTNPLQSVYHMTDGLKAALARISSGNNELRPSDRQQPNPHINGNSHVHGIGNHSKMLHTPKMNRCTNGVLKAENMEQGNSFSAKEAPEVERMVKEEGSFVKEAREDLYQELNVVLRKRKQTGTKVNLLDIERMKTGKSIMYFGSRGPGDDLIATATPPVSPLMGRPADQSKSPGITVNGVRGEDPDSYNSKESPGPANSVLRNIQSFENKILTKSGKSEDSDINKRHDVQLVHTINGVLTQKQTSPVQENVPKILPAPRTQSIASTGGSDDPMIDFESKSVTSYRSEPPRGSHLPRPSSSDTRGSHLPMLNTKQSEISRPGSAIKVGSSVPGAAIKVGSSVPGAAIKVGSSVPGAAIKVGSSVPGAAIKVGSSVPGASDDRYDHHTDSMASSHGNLSDKLSTSSWSVDIEGDEVDHGDVYSRAASRDVSGLNHGGHIPRDYMDVVHQDEVTESLPHSTAHSVSRSSPVRPQRATQSVASSPPVRPHSATQSVASSPPVRPQSATHLSHETSIDSELSTAGTPPPPPPLPPSLPSSSTSPHTSTESLIRPTRPRPETYNDAQVSSVIDQDFQAEIVKVALRMQARRDSVESLCDLDIGEQTQHSTSDAAIDALANDTAIRKDVAITTEVSNLKDIAIAKGPVLAKVNNIIKDNFEDNNNRNTQTKSSRDLEVAISEPEKYLKAEQEIKSHVSSDCDVLVQIPPKVPRGVHRYVGGLVSTPGPSNPEPSTSKRLPRIQVADCSEQVTVLVCDDQDEPVPGSDGPCRNRSVSFSDSKNLDHSGLDHPKPDYPGSDHPGSDHPGSSHPGSSHPGSDHPGSDHPGSDHPGTLISHLVDSVRSQVETSNSDIAAQSDHSSGLSELLPHDVADSTLSLSYSKPGSSSLPAQSSMFSPRSTHTTLTQTSNMSLSTVTSYDTSTIITTFNDDADGTGNHGSMHTGQHHCQADHPFKARLLGDAPPKHGGAHTVVSKSLDNFLPDDTGITLQPIMSSDPEVSHNHSTDVEDGFATYPPPRTSRHKTLTSAPDQEIITSLMITHSGDRIPPDGAETQPDHRYNNRLNSNVTIPEPTSFHQHANKVGNHFLTPSSTQVSTVAEVHRSSSLRHIVPPEPLEPQQEPQVAHIDYDKFEYVLPPGKNHPLPKRTSLDKEAQRYMLYYTWSSNSALQQQHQKGNNLRRVKREHADDDSDSSGIHLRNRVLKEGVPGQRTPLHVHRSPSGNKHKREVSEGVHGDTGMFYRRRPSSQLLDVDQPPVNASRYHQGDPTSRYHQGDPASRYHQGDPAASHQPKLSRNHENGSDGDTESLYQDYDEYEESLIRYVKPEDLCHVNENIKSLYRQQLEPSRIATMMDAPSSFLQRLSCCFVCQSERSSLSALVDPNNDHHGNNNQDKMESYTQPELGVSKHHKDDMLDRYWQQDNSSLGKITKVSPKILECG